MPTLAHVTPEDQQLAVWSGQELLGVSILMDYSGPMLTPGRKGAIGRAAVRWTFGADLENRTSQKEFKAISAAFLYARVLAFDAVNRGELFRRVDDAVRKWFSTGGGESLDFDAWRTTTATDDGELTETIWPWRAALWTTIQKPRHDAAADAGRLSAADCVRMHDVGLFRGPATPQAPAGLWLRYRPDNALGAVLIPAAPLVLIQSVWRKVPESRGLLLSLLHFINRRYESATPVPGWDALVIDAALRDVFKAADAADAAPQRIPQDDAPRPSTLSETRETLCDLCGWSLTESELRLFRRKWFAMWALGGALLALITSDGSRDAGALGPLKMLFSLGFAAVMAMGVGCFDWHALGHLVRLGFTFRNGELGWDQQKFSHLFTNRNVKGWACALVMLAFLPLISLYNSWPVLLAAFGVMGALSAYWSPTVRRRTLGNVLVVCGVVGGAMLLPSVLRQEEANTAPTELLLGIVAAALVVGWLLRTGSTDK